MKNTTYFFHKKFELLSLALTMLADNNLQKGSSWMDEAKVGKSSQFLDLGDEKRWNYNIIVAIKSTEH